MKFNIKDRVVLIRNSGSKKDQKGLIVKLHVRGGKVKTCGVLWDSDWPREALKKFQKPGKVFYYSPDDLKVIDTWSV